MKKSFFPSHFSGTTETVSRSTKMEKAKFTPGKNQEKQLCLPPEKFSCYAPEAVYDIMLDDIASILVMGLSMCRQLSM